MTTGIGIVGCGLIGGKRARNVPPKARVVAVCDVDSARAEVLASDLPGVTVEPSVDALVARGDIALVVVATTHDSLCTVAHRAVDAAKHVLVEKPGGHRVDDLAALRDAAANAGVHVRVGYNHRFHPGLRKLRECVESRAYGPVMFVRARYGHGGRLGYEQEWRANREISGGGELIDQGSHLIDLTRSLLGNLDVAFAELPTMFWAMPVEDNAFLALRSPSGAFAWLHASWTEWKNLFSFEVMLERAKVEVQGLGGSYGAETCILYEMQPEMGPPPVTRWEYPADDGSWYAEMADVLGIINDGAPGWGASVADAVATFQIIDEAYRT